MRRLAREPETGRALSPTAIARAGDPNQPGEARAQPTGPAEEQRHAPLVPTLTLTVLVAFGAFALLMSVVMLLVHPQPIPGLDATQRQGAETALYLAAFGVILPLSLLVGPRMADAVARGPNAAAQSAISGLLAAGLAFALILARLTDVFEWGGGMTAVLLAVGVWLAAAAATLVVAARDRFSAALDRMRGFEVGIWVAAAMLTAGAVLTVAHLDSIDPMVLLLGAVSVLVCLGIGVRRVPRLHGRWGLLADLAVAAVVGLAVVDLVFITPDDPGASLLDRYLYGVMQFHHDFLLGPANQVLGGGTMLVDTASQYGVGSIVFLAGWFCLVPIGYGTLALLDGLLTALYFAAGYSVLRAAAASRVLSASALSLGVVVLVLNRSYPVGGLPQEGPLRLGLPMALILAAVLAARWERWSRWAESAALVVLAIASIWALEAFAMTAGVFAALAGFRAYLLPAGSRLRWLVRTAVVAVGSCAAAHLLFAVATLARSGDLPDWGQYLAYLDAFLLGDLGDLTYDFSPWSSGIAIAALYLASAAAIALLLRRNKPFVKQEQVALLALTGTTAYGIFLFNYYVDRSGDHVVPYVSMPALLIGTLWLNLVLRSGHAIGTRVRTGALAFGLAVSVMVLAVAWSAVPDRFSHTALAHVLPGGDSPRDALARLKHFPPIDPRSVEAERVLERHMPGERHSVVLIRPSVANEALMRSRRSNRLPLADPWGDGFVVDERRPGLERAVDDLRTGDRILLDAGGIGALAQIKADPSFAPLIRTAPGSPLAALQVFSLKLINDRFRLKPVFRDDEGNAVFAIRSRR